MAANKEHPKDRNTAETCEAVNTRSQSPRISLRSAGSSTGHEEEFFRDEDRSIGVYGANRQVLNPELNVDDGFWAPIRSDSAAAGVWNASEEAIIRFLDERALRWSTLHLGVVNNCTAVAIIYESGGCWEEDGIVTGLRKSLLPEGLFSKIRLLKPRAAKGAALGSASYAKQAGCGAQYPAFLDNAGAIHEAASPGSINLAVVQPPCGYHKATVDSLKTMKQEAEERLTGIQNNLDWGIFRIPQHRVRVNMVDTEPDRDGLWKSLRSAPCLQPEINDLVLNVEVAKIGMKTGITFGRVNGVMDPINLKENGRRTEEQCIVGLENCDKRFSSAGDSGSFVFNKKLQVVGILTAGCDHYDRLTYMTPIRLVLEDIR
ncbi:uncharacterized protein DFL_005771 [Arthrobotrys flagrans]|uniref:Peptidase S1 domain-containing protein n=1 Tax=Arthrobotrys flagrans TaxID=97331 RepID=A0A436ZYI3_ARTFL|nr:hypothetical protein DFL_005771 [Arthrobotrys flagrans]